MSVSDKISAWLNDKNNNENDLIDFLVDECGVVLEEMEEEVVCDCGVGVWCEICDLEMSKEPFLWKDTEGDFCGCSKCLAEETEEKIVRKGANKE